MKRTLLVTGANGFVGRALLKAAVTHGWQLRAAVRRPSALGPSMETVLVGDLGADTDWSAAVAGCDAVVHLAALVHAMHAEETTAYERINAEGTRRLAEQAAKAGVSRFVLLSTVKVLGESSPPSRPLCDEDPASPQDAYAESKLEAEEALFQVCTHSGVEPVVLRPPLVYGAAAKGNFATMLSAVAAGWPLPLGALSSRRTFCYLGNLTDAMLTALEHPDVVGRRFLIGDGETMKLPDFVRQMASALGRPARLVPVPASWLRLAGGLLGRSEQVRRLTESLELDISGFQRATGWRPPYSIAAALDETARAYLARHDG